MTRPAACVLLCLIACAAVGAENPNTAKGFQPGHLYQFGELSHVNLFNANLNLSLPIGQTFPVGGNLSYGFTLTYAGNNWESVFREKEVTDPDGNKTPKDFYHMIPSQRSNAGLGWYFSSGGQMSTNGVDPAQAPVAQWAYRTADAAEYDFPGGPVGESGDTYLRLKAVDCGDGSSCRDVEFPDGTIHRFKETGGMPLTGIRDLFGNNVAVSITPAIPVSGLPATPPVWQFTDAVGRIQTVTFERLSIPMPLPQAGDEPKSFDVVKTVQVTAFNGATATYTFHYSPGVNGSDNMVLIDRPLLTNGCACNDGEISESVYVPLLTSITLPDGSSYSMTYHPGVGEERSFTGNIASVTLPTLGKYEWAYQTYSFPSSVYSPPPGGGGILPTPDTLNSSIGLLDEIKRDAAGNAVLHTHYDTQLNGTQSIDSSTTLRNTVSVFAPGAQQETLLSRSVHYFQVGLSSDLGHGLPITGDSPGTADPALIAENIPNPDIGGGKTRYLSTKTYDGSGRLLTYSYLSYGVSTFVDSEKVVYRNPIDDTRVSRTSDSSDFDGYGHYRTVVTSGNGFAGSGGNRTVTTTYNQVDPSTGGSIFDTGTFGTGNARTIASNAPWLINLYSSITATEGSSVSKSLYSFNTTNGFLERTRALAVSSGVLSPGVHDIVTRFTPDNSGNVQLEENYGGDIASVGNQDPLADITLSNRQYAQYHLYTSGALSNTSYIDPLCTSIPQTSCAAVLNSVDRTIDAGTGLTAKARDASSLETIFNYDTSGRLLGVAPPGVAPTSYTYTKATSTNPASVAAETAIGSSTDGLKSIYTYDGLGRLVIEATIANDMTRYRSTVYDALGRKLSESGLEASATPTLPTTRFAYDALNRVISVTQPDNSITSFDRDAEPVTTKRTTSVHTAAGDTPETTIETYDHQNRLTSLQEPNGTITTYTYDVAGHLTSVTMPGESSTTQHRHFAFDGRGLLQSEQHPELGVDGDGTTTYGGYDARGHAHYKRTGSVGGTYDLALDYDAAERLTALYDVGGSQHPNPGGGHLLKTFTFGEANGTGTTTDYRKGKLLTAARFSQSPSPLSGGFVTTETYKYENTSGRPSERDTEVKNGSTVIQSFKQLFTYDPLGAAATPGYPTCLSPINCVSMPSYTTASYVYANGLLTNVQGFGTLTYNVNGTLGTVSHANSVVDTTEPDDNGMPRPKSITYAPWSSCAPPDAPSVTAASSVCPGSSNNAASVISPDPDATYSWSISPPDAHITSGSTGTSISYSAGTGPVVTLSVTATKSCGVATTNRTVAVGSPTATVSNGNSPAVVQAVLTGTSPWSITWSDNVIQSNITSSPATRTVAPGIYTVTSVHDHDCTGTSSGAAIVLATPQSLNARTTDADSSVVHVTWAPVTNATAYRVERARCRFTCTWDTFNVGTSPYDDHLTATAQRVTYLYHVVALAAGTSSAPSTTDYATTATTLFAEPIVGGVTPVRGTHVTELRQAIDAARQAADLAPYTSVSPPEGWVDYSPPTGLLLGADIGAMRRALDDAISILTGSHLPRTDPSGALSANDFNQLREAVR